MTSSRRWQSAVVGAAAVILGGLAPAGAQEEPFEEHFNIRVSPVLPSASDVINVHFALWLGCDEPVFAPPVVTQDMVLLRGTYDAEEDCPSLQPRFFKLPIGRLPAGDYRLLVEMKYFNRHSETDSYALHVEPATDKLRFQIDEYAYVEAEVAWINQHDGGTTGKGRPVRLSEQSGYFWFFDPEISEVTLKILDGRALNSHYWIFLASMTDVDVTVKVKLKASYCEWNRSCPTRTYHLPPGSVEGIVDFEAF